ncbi:MAG: tetratricopeptide repeat protein, partial [Proteobacteria bacterium]|nr:tetratricopeptide repeat protein [Pseudomonadota bacterium]
MDRLEEAANRFEQAALAPKLRLDALEALAQVQSTQSRFDDALATYETLAAEHPEHPTGHFGRCDTLLRMDRAEEALPHCRNSVALGPDNPAYLARLGDALHLLGSNAEAIARYEDALALDPTNLDVRNNLGATLKVLGQFRKAQEEFERCLEQNPDHLPALTNLAMALKEQGDAHLASRHLERAVRLAPDDLSLQLYLAMSRIPFAYATGEDIATCRAAYARDLTLLATAVASATPSTLAELARNIGRLQPYYLPYQGQNDCELMTLYGTIIHRTMNATWATLAQAAEHSFPAPPQAGERVRVGFVSGHFRDHSVWKLPTRGWCAGLDRERFMVTGYSVSSRTDPETAVARQIFDRFQEDLTTLPALAEAIRRDAPHILIYPELGMDPLCARAACLRLAPVQCVSWGHPQTSGLGTMDYFLSSDLMEPANSEEHYSEKLVRLPGLGVAYHPSSPAPSNERREDFGLREDDTVYLCLQTLYKYLPSQDATFATIAAKVPASRFVFLENSGAAHLNRLFRKRLEQAFTAAGLAPDRHLVFLPQLPGDRFQALASLGDIFLDSFGWSGCNSSLESMAHGAVPVTLPGALMRGRHT